ncbi:head maturation protease, ClpP-related [Chitinimonas lacunae]|uniref:ATP-dependent Clp protease proteolytic subunit n=1 Tax=Chitinimonas lacunae TaxID=1963018 RepID=A0ABV8MLW5_9NEIS
MKKIRPRVYAMAGGTGALAGSAPLATDKPTQRWYNMAAQNDASVRVDIYDEIGGWGIRAADFSRDLKALDDGKKKVNVHINSPGGDVFDGIAINNLLAQMGDRCTVYVDGWAASSASIIAVGAHKVVMADNALMMIHNPWTFAMGDAAELRATADALDVCRTALVASYRRKATAVADAELIRLLDAETWLTPTEAVALGLADEVSGASTAKACVVPRLMASYRNAPKWASETPEPAPAPAPDPTPVPAPEPTLTPPPTETPAALAARITAACRRAGVADLTEIVLARTGLRPADVAAEERRISSIHDLCVAARYPGDTLAHVREGKTLEEVQAQLLDKYVAAAGPEIDNTPPADPPAPAPSALSKLNPLATFEKRKQQTKGVK